jgi:hypothetical protein
LRPTLIIAYCFVTSVFFPLSHWTHCSDEKATVQLEINVSIVLWEIKSIGRIRYLYYSLFITLCAALSYFYNTPCKFVRHILQMFVFSCWYTFVVLLKIDLKKECLRNYSCTDNRPTILNAVYHLALQNWRFADNTNR